LSESRPRLYKRSSAVSKLSLFGSETGVEPFARSIQHGTDQTIESMAEDDCWTETL